MDADIFDAESDDIQFANIKLVFLWQFLRDDYAHGMGFALL